MAATVTTDLAGGVLTVTLNRPEQLNALSFPMQRELAGVWAAAQGDPGVRCVLLTGAGRAFCAGADVADLAAITATDQAGTKRVEFCPAASLEIPVVLAVNGLCVGAGLRFLADADISIASDQAWFSDPHVTIGQVGTPVALALAEKASSPAVAQLFLSGSRLRMPADRALAAGLLGEVAAAGALAARALEIATSIAAQSPTATRATVAALRQQHRAALGDQVAHAWAEVDRQQSHPDAAEGGRALREGRAPRWTRPAEPRQKETR
jgi:enoyl-CoA hydratase/carnithine racemase